MSKVRYFPKILRRMLRESQRIELNLTLEEALDLFYRCLNSSEADSPSVTSAMRKLGQAIETAEVKPKTNVA